MLTGYKLTVHNKSMSMGCYYPEDDWTLSYIGQDLPSLINEFWDNYPTSDIRINNAEVEEVLYVVYENVPVVVKEVKKYSATGKFLC